jgi:uncharacterized protein YbcC (UPF0753/DUF2309 family)
MATDDEPYHQPLRLPTVVHAPVERIPDVLADHGFRNGSEDIRLGFLVSVGQPI